MDLNFYFQEFLHYWEAEIYQINQIQKWNAMTASHFVPQDQVLICCKKLELKNQSACHHLELSIGCFKPLDHSFWPYLYACAKSALYPMFARNKKEKLGNVCTWNMFLELHKRLSNTLVGK